MLPKAIYWVSNISMPACLNVCWQLVIYAVVCRAFSGPLGLDQLRREAAEAIRVGSLQKAEAIYRSALLQFGRSHSTDEVVLWNEIGGVCQKESKLDDAQLAYQRAVEINESLGQPAESELVVSLNNLGSISEWKGDFAAAERLFRRSYSTLQKKNALDDSSMAGSVLSNLALSIQQQGRYREAQELSDLAFEIIRRHSGEGSIEYAKVLSNSALWSLDTGRYQEGISKAREALAIENRLEQATNGDKAFALNNLAVGLTDVGSFSEAEALFLEAIRLQESGPVPDPKVVQTLSNIAMLERRSAHFSAAQAYETRALQVAQGYFSPGDVLFATIWNNLGMIAADLHHVREARSLYERAANRWLKMLGENDPKYATALSNLAGLMSKEGHAKQAQGMYEKALAIKLARLGPDHPDVALALTSVAAQLYFQKKYQQAISLYERAQAVNVSAFGSKSEAVARTLHNMAIVHQASNQIAESVNAYRQATSILEAVLGPETPELTSWLREYAQALRRDGKFAEAEEVEVRATRVQVRNIIKPTAMSEVQLAGTGTNGKT